MVTEDDFLLGTGPSTTRDGWNDWNDWNAFFGHRAESSLSSQTARCHGRPNVQPLTERLLTPSLVAARYTADREYPRNAAAATTCVTGCGPASR